MTLATLAPSILLAALAAGVPSQTPPAAGTPAPAAGGIAGTSWRAVELAGMPVPAQPSPEREPHLVFIANGRVAGADGCNRLTGPYTVNGEAITFGELAATMMACPGTDEIVRRFRSALEGTGHWRIENGRLQLYGATGKPLAVFEPREVPEP